MRRGKGRRRGLPTTRYQAGRLMEKMGIAAFYPKPDTSKAAKGHAGWGGG